MCPIFRSDDVTEITKLQATFGKEDAMSETEREEDVLDVLGPTIQHLTKLSISDDDFCVLKGLLRTGVVVPLHNHPDRETFYILAGELEILKWVDSGPLWHRMTAGDVLDVPSGTKHALRNSAAADAVILIVMTMKHGQFFRDVGRPAATTPPVPPSEADLQRFVQMAHDYGYWLGSPEDNAAVGLRLD
jgi:mannose-6-phosphate isomerase-like protein (cupin superfamily)